MLLQLVDAALESVAGSNITTLECHVGGHRVRIERLQSDVAKCAESGASAVAEHGPATDLAPSAKPATILRATMYGTFFRAASPDQSPLAEPGQTVEAGQQLGILEAMKTLHAVEAESAGTIQEFFVESGAAVEAGTALLSIQEAEHG